MQCRAVARCSIFVLCWLPCHGLHLNFAKPHVPSRAAAVFANANEDATDNGLSASDNEFLSYWRAHSAKWDTPLRMLDVSTAWQCGELDGVLPSGVPSRVATSERMLTLGRAIELFEQDQLQVRRRFRNMTPIEMAPRWDRVMATRARLQAAGKYDDIVRESDKTRAFQRARVRGEVEDAEASPAISRVVATVLSPALKAAATQRARLDGGLSLAFAELLETAGDTPRERWLTAVLLAELEAEVAELEATAAAAQPDGKAKSVSFAEVEAQRDVAQANSLGVIGVGAAVFVVLIQALAGGFGGGGDDALQRTLDLMQ